MTASRPVVVTTASILLLSCMLASVVLLRRVDQMRTAATLQEVLYITSPKMLKRLSLGYEGLMADIYWTRAVQYFGTKHYNYANRYDLLAPLLELTTALDPHLIVAYQFGGNFLAPAPPNGAGMPEKAIQLMEYGIHNNPDDWHLYYQLGFIYYLDKKDYANAAEAFQRGTRVPNTHPYLKVLAAQMAQHAGEIQTARMLWVTTYQTTKDRLIRANAVAHLRALQVDDDVSVLQHAVTLYGQKTGHLPASISAMVAAGVLWRIPVDPDGHTYKLMPDGRIEVRSPEDFPFVEKGLPPGYTPPPPKLNALAEKLGN
jgi:tetratricopeptide (TPR) repeat protein